MFTEYGQRLKYSPMKKVEDVLKTQWALILTEHDWTVWLKLLMVQTGTFIVLLTSVRKP